MTRLQVEDKILELLRAGLPSIVRVESLPLGINDRLALDVRDAAVWVVYDSGRAVENKHLGGLSQAEKWTWSVVILSKNYRSAKSGASSALELLEETIKILVGAKIGDAMLVKDHDQLANIQDGVGIVGYELYVSLTTYLRRLL